MMNPDPIDNVYLLIGGPWDGSRQRVYGDLDTLKLIKKLESGITLRDAEISPTNKIEDYFLYSRMKLRGSTKDFVIYVDATMNGDQVIQALIEGYCP